MKKLLMFIFIQTACVASFRNEYYPGVVLPNDPYIFIGNELKLTCNLTSVTPETSASLYFTKANVVYPKSVIKVLSSRSIQLVLPIVSPEDSGSYVCKLNKSTGGYPQVIGNQFVVVEYAPRKVESLSCEVYNWESMTCHWDLGVQYVNPDHIEVQLVWTVRDLQQYDCPNLTKTSCHWKSNNGQDSFRTDMLYHMAVIVRNKITGNQTQSDIFKEDTRKLVRPSSVSELKKSHNSTCLKLQWRHNRPDQEKQYRIQYHSKWEVTDKWKVISLDDVQEKTICDLVPNTEYTIKLACRPLWDGFWSEEVQTIIKLDQDVPGASPELQPGGFVEKPCSFQDCRVITVYWRPIIDRLANGEITNYKVTSQAMEMTGPPTQLYTGSRTVGQLMLSASTDYIIDIQGETKKGISPHRASILILAKDKKPPYPDGLVVEAEKADMMVKDVYNVDIRWSEPTTSQRILGYTLFWCKGSSSDQMCIEPLKWAVLKGNQQKFSMTVQKVEMQSLLFGISMETVHSSGETVSSGILWNDCVYMKNQKPLMAPKNVRMLSLVDENSLRVEWDRFKCSEMAGYITHYSIFYCSSQTAQNCSGKYNVMDVDGQKTSVTLKDMSPKTTYRVWIQARSDGGSGPQSDPIFTTIPVIGIDLSNGEIAGIVISILLVFVLAVIGFILLFRKCASEVKEQFKPYDIDLPHVPLPPIPMIRPESKMSQSPDSDDDIYSKIPDFPPSPSSPESMSIDMPLINHSDSQNKAIYGDKKKLYVKLPETGRSVVSAALLFSRLNKGRQSTESHYVDNKNMSTFRPRPKRVSDGLSSSADMLSSDVSPYSCVDVVQCPNSEKIPRKHIPCSKPCHSVGSVVDDPDYETNNLSVLTNKAVTKPPSTLAIGDSREHFNIKLPLDRRKSDVMNYTINSCVSNEINSVMETDEETQDSNDVSDDRVSSYVQGAQIGETNNSSDDVSCGSFGPKCSNNNDVKMRNGYIMSENITEILRNPSIVIDEDGSDTYRKELNIKPGPRPVSEVINVPAHFYGSLSLLDTGTATEL